MIVNDVLIILSLGLVLIKLLQHLENFAIIKGNRISRRSKELLSRDLVPNPLVSDLHKKFIHTEAKNCVSLQRTSSLSLLY